MNESRRHLKSVITKGINSHNKKGEIPRATRINHYPSHTAHKLDKSTIVKIFRDGDNSLKNGAIKVKLESGSFNVRLRTGVKHYRQRIGDNKLWTKCTNEGHTLFKDDFTMKEVEYYLYELMDSGKELSYWYEKKYNRIVIPTNKNNRPTSEYLNGHSLERSEEQLAEERDDLIVEYNLNYLQGLEVSNSAISRLKTKGYLNDEFFNTYNNTDKWAKVQEIIEKDKDTRSERRRTINKVKNNKSKLSRVLYDYYPELGKFEIRTSKAKYVHQWWDVFKMFPTMRTEYNYLLLWDKKGDRIYHSLWS